MNKKADINGDYPRDKSGRFLGGEENCGRPYGAKSKATILKDRLIKLVNDKLSSGELEKQVELKDIFVATGRLLPKESTIHSDSEQIKINIIPSVVNANTDKRREAVKPEDTPTLKEWVKVVKPDTPVFNRSLKENANNGE